MAVPHLRTTDLRRMGRKNHPPFILGRRLLPAAASERGDTSDGGPRFGLQVDTYPVQVLEITDTLQ